MDFPLRGIDLCLRPLQAGDAEAFHQAALESVDTVGFWLPWLDANYSLEQAQAWIDSCNSKMASEDAYFMGIFSLDGTQVIGGVGITYINRQHNFANIGYWVRSSRQHQGIGFDALRLICDFGFNELHLSRLEIVVAEDNVISRRLAEKMGAQFECIARNRLRNRDKLYAAAMYSLIPK